MKHPQMLHEKFDQCQIWANNTQHVATHRNRVAKRAQHVAIVWSGLSDNLQWGREKYAKHRIEIFMVMASYPVGDLGFFFVPARSCHVDQFTFHYRA